MLEKAKATSHTLSQSRQPNLTQTVKEYVSSNARNQSERRKPVGNRVDGSAIIR